MNKLEGSALALGATILSSAIATAADASPKPAPEMSPTPSPVTEFVSPNLHTEYLNANPLKRLEIHTGSESIDRNDLTQEEIEKAVNAMVDKIPNLTHIAIGTYLNYPEQIRMWANAIHAAGKNIDLRSAGFTSWKGEFGDQATGTPEQHNHDFAIWLEQNLDMFEKDDIVETQPDESENGDYWYRTYGANGVGTNSESKGKFNKTLIEGIKNAREILNKHGKKGVIVEVYHGNPSMIKDVLSPEVVSLLAIVGGDYYPDPGEKTIQNYGKAMADNLYDWKYGIFPENNWGITLGPGAEGEEQISDEVQVGALEEQIKMATSIDDNVDSLTVWLFGSETTTDSGENPFPARLFNYEENGDWEARAAVEILDKIKVVPQS